jgi:glucosamine-phosphate N-acetyltransferase
MENKIEYKILELTAEILSKNKNFLNTLSNMRKTGNISLEKQLEILKKINIQDGHIFIAIKDDNIIGTSTILIEQKFIRNGAKTGHIEDVSVDKNITKSGVGYKVVNECIEYAKKRKCYKIILDCSEDVKIFYEKLGFKAIDYHMRIDLI